MICDSKDPAAQLVGKRAIQQARDGGRMEA